jgi:hypothetical protein
MNLFLGLELYMEKWLQGSTKPLILYVAHVMDMLWKSFPIEGHEFIRWFVETWYKEDEDDTVHLIVGNPTPIAFLVVEEATIFVNEGLQSLHILLPSIKETV